MILDFGLWILDWKYGGAQWTATGARDSLMCAEQERNDPKDKKDLNNAGRRVCAYEVGLQSRIQNPESKFVQLWKTAAC